MCLKASGQDDSADICGTGTVPHYIKIINNSELPDLAEQKSSSSKDTMASM